MLGSRTIGAISQDSAAMVGRQLPAGENGWVVIFGCDNYLLPNGPLRVGNQLLAKAKQGIVLFGHSEKLVGRSASEVDYLKGLGVFFTDAQTGEITAFREKMMTPRGDFDLDAATEMLSEHGGERVYKNTYFFAMRQDVAAAWYKGFERPSVLDGRPLHESYDIDFSNHFTLACLSSKDEWIALYKARDKRAKAFAEGDWMFLWEHAQKIKELAGGIAGADIGSGEDTWSDIGTIEAFYSRLARILSSNQVIRRVTRFMLGRLPENESVHNSNVAGVETPEDESFFVGNTVFRKGGKIGKNVIIIGSIFEDYVEIPDNTIIIGSRVHNISFQEGDRSRKLIYSLHQDSLDPTLDIRGNCAHSTMFLINGQKQTGVFPIALGGKEVRADEMGRPAKDRLLAWYDMDGSMVTQPIMGMPQTTDARLIDRLLRFGTDPAVAHVASVKNLKRISSLGRTEQAERRLAADIQTAL